MTPSTLVRTSAALWSAFAFPASAAADAAGGRTDSAAHSASSPAVGLAEPADRARATEAAEPEAGGTLAFLVGAEVTGLDPLTAYSSSSTGGVHRMYPIYDGLVVQNPETQDIEMRIAESLTTDDGQVWTLRLHEGVEFSDGTPFDADAVVYNWRRHQDPDSGSSWHAIMEPWEFEAVDPLTVRVTLPTPDYQFVRTLAEAPNFIGSPTAIETLGDDFGSAPVGAGPFTVASWVRDSELVLERNPNYWNAPRPYLDRVVLRPITDEQQRINTFESEPGAVMFSSLASTAVALDDRYEALRVPQIGAEVVQFNIARPVTGDHRVRQAIQLAIDIEQYNEVATGGSREPATSFFPSTSRWSDPEVVLPAQDVAEAQRLMDDYFAETGQDAEVLYTFIVSPQAQLRAELLQAQVNAIEHLEVVLDPVDAPQYRTQLNGYDFDMAFLLFQGPDPYPQFNTLVMSGGSRNRSGYDNPQLDQLLTAEREASDDDERLQVLTEIQRIIIDDVVDIPLMRLENTFYAAEGVRGLVTEGEGALLLDGAWLVDAG